MLEPKIIFKDEDILVLNKPPTWFVHPPENPKHRRGLKRRTCVQWLSDQHSIKASPAHRLDVATEGLLLFGLHTESLQNLNSQFREHSIKKKYLTVVRGWLKEKEGCIIIPLELKTTGDLAECETNYTTLAKIEHDTKISKKFDTSRFSLLDVSPRTGRWHQIRRHMNRISHPILGDTEHGDTHQNRYFRENLKIEGLCLLAHELSFVHPSTGLALNFKSELTPRWQRITEMFKTDYI